ncbi:hypothetical protein [Streptomyces tubercidicus]
MAVPFAAAGQEVDFDPAVEPLLRHLLGGGWVSLTDLAAAADLTVADAAAVARELVDAQGRHGEGRLVVTASLTLGTYRLREVATAARRAAACPGTAWVDTTPNYLAGRAQRLLAPVLADHPELQVSTKVGFPAPGAAAAVAAGVLPPEDAERGHSLAAGYVRWQDPWGAATPSPAPGATHHRHGSRRAGALRAQQRAGLHAPMLEGRWRSVRCQVERDDTAGFFSRRRTTKRCGQS